MRLESGFTCPGGSFQYRSAEMRLMVAWKQTPWEERGVCLVKLLQVSLFLCTLGDHRYLTALWWVLKF